MNYYICIADLGLGGVRYVSSTLAIPNQITELPVGLSALLIAPDDVDFNYFMSLYYKKYIGTAEGIVELSGDWQADFVPLQSEDLLAVGPVS
jgi:hypothetical protein